MRTWRAARRACRAGSMGFLFGVEDDDEEGDEADGESMSNGAGEPARLDADMLAFRWT